MRSFAYILLVLTAGILLQMFLSRKDNKYLGLIIPGINLSGSVFTALLFSDRFAAILIFVISIAPMAIWLGIYTASKRKMKKKRQSEINRMRINDL